MKHAKHAAMKRVIVKIVTIVNCLNKCKKVKIQLFICVRIVFDKLRTKLLIVCVPV